MMSHQNGGKDLDDGALAHIDVLRRQHQRDNVINRPRTVVTFESPLTLTVIKFPAIGNTEVIGTTPSDNPITFNLGPDDTWAVYAPNITPAYMGQLVTDLANHAVPSLILMRNSLGPSELAQLAGATLLTTLILGRDWASLDGIEALDQLAQLVIVNNTLIMDAELSALAGMAALEQLILTNSPNISNGGMSHLAVLTGLKHLYLNRTTVDDAGIATLLSGAPEIIGLHMERLNVTDNTVTQVIARPNMVALDFDETSISDGGAAQLATLTALRDLDLRDNKGGDIQNATLLSLSSALSNLRIFAVTSPDIDDAGMANISTLTQMVDLTLRGTALTDGGLPNFTSLTGMHDLWAASTGVTSAGKAYLEGAITGLTVHI